MSLEIFTKRPIDHQLVEIVRTVGPASIKLITQTLNDAGYTRSYQTVWAQLNSGFFLHEFKRSPRGHLMKIYSIKQNGNGRGN